MPLFDVTVTLMEPDRRENRRSLSARARSCLEAVTGVGRVDVKFGHPDGAEPPFLIEISESSSLIRLDEAARDRLGALLRSKLRQSLWWPRLVDPASKGFDP